MKFTRLENICNGLLQLLGKGKRIEEDNIYIYLDGMLDVMEKQTNEWPTSYVKLNHYVGQMWELREIDRLTQEQTFLLGSIWGTAKLMEMKRQREKRRYEITDLASVYFKNKWIFREISARPGVRHIELAAKGKRSASGLTQLLSQMIQKQLIACNHMGRENHYYLLDRGEQVYEKIKEDEKKQRRLKKDQQGMQVLANAIIANNRLGEREVGMLDVQLKSNRDFYKFVFANQLDHGIYNNYLVNEFEENKDLINDNMIGERDVCENPIKNLLINAQLI